MKATVLISALLLIFGFAEKAYGQSLVPFDGNWRGSAMLAKERMRCTAYNSGDTGGALMKMVLKCAAGGFALHVRASIRQSAGVVSGTWEERTYNVFGNISGTVTDGLLNARIVSPNYSTSLVVRKNGSGLVVSVAPSGDIKGFNVTLSR